MLATVKGDSVFTPIAVGGRLVRVLGLFLPLVFVTCLKNVALFARSRIMGKIVVMRSRPFGKRRRRARIRLRAVFFLSSFTTSNDLFAPSSAAIF